MYEILRVPPGPGHMTKAYDMIQSFINPTALRMTVDEFYKNAKSVYIIADKCAYYGIGYLCHKVYENYENPIVFRPYGNNIYAMHIILFSDEDAYLKVFELVRTITKDSTDRMILIEDVPNTNSDIINALKNNGFKQYKRNTNSYSSAYYKMGNKISTDEKNYRDINPIDDLHTIDKHICLCDKVDLVKEAQDRYTQELIEKNMSEMNNTVNCAYGCDECSCDRQTVSEFLGKRNCICKYE